MKFILDKYYEKTRGFYPFFKYCPKIYWEHYLKRRAFDALGYEYDWKNPKTLNEKIRWLIYNEKLDLKTKLTDKILVKSYVAQKIGKNHSAELYGVYDDFDEIDFDVLPNEFLLKANSGWQMNLFVKNKKELNKNVKKNIKIITKKWLNTNFEHFSLEPQYRNIKRKLLIERRRMICPETYRQDIQVHCFNGKPLFFEMRYNKYLQFYNEDWELQNFTHTNELIKEPMINRPKYLENIIKYSKILAEGFSYVRVDFAMDEEDIHVVEMTFTPQSAMTPFHGKELDLKLGELLILPTESDRK